MPVSPELRRYLDSHPYFASETEETEEGYVSRVPAFADVPDRVLLRDLYRGLSFKVRKRLKQAGLEKRQQAVVIGALGVADRQLRLRACQLTAGDMRGITEEDWRKLRTFKGLGPRRIQILKKLFGQEGS